MEATNIIRVFEICGRDLITREAAQELIASIDLSPCSVCNEFELDFANVQFMSRSFADEFHKAKLSLQAQAQCTIQVFNTSKEVLEMLNAVAKTQVTTGRKQTEVPVYRFNDAKSLSDYLMAL